MGKRKRKRILKKKYGKTKGTIPHPIVFSKTKRGQEVAERRRRRQAAAPKEPIESKKPIEPKETTGFAKESGIDKKEAAGRMAYMMLGCIINSDNDVEIFLTDEEVLDLGLRTIEGEIFEYSEPANVRKLRVSVDRDKASNYIKSRNMIGTDYTDKEYDVFLHPRCYKELRDSGWVGTRAGFIKIDLVKYSFAPLHDEFKKDVKSITSKYRETRRAVLQVKD